MDCGIVLAQRVSGVKLAQARAWSFSVLHFRLSARRIPPAPGLPGILLARRIVSAYNRSRHRDSNSMTIQVTVANAYGVAMASDRHVYRAAQTLSTGRQVKLHRLRGPVPSAMMCAGRFSVLGFPVSRLSLRFEQALEEAAAAGPEALAEAATAVLRQPLCVPDGGDDAEALAAVAEMVVGRTQAYGGTEAALGRLLAEIGAAPRCHNSDAVEAVGRSAWRAGALAASPSLATSPSLAETLKRTPDLLGEAVIGALVRNWSRPSDVQLMIGLCCPVTGVPAVVAVNIWKGLSGCLLYAPRADQPACLLRRAGRSLVLSQGSGRGNVCGMIEGVSGDHTDGSAQTETIAAAVDRRWQHVHDRIGVSSPAELASVAAGLVRGAEVIGYLTGEDEGSIAEVDSLLLTPQGVASHVLARAPEHSELA
jgi:hypothetical protein